MYKNLSVFFCVVLLGLPALAFQDRPSDRAKQVDALLAMPAKERVAQLKSLSPSERRGLWLQLKKEEKARQGLHPRNDRGRTPKTRDVKVAAKKPSKMAGTITYDDGVGGVTIGGGGFLGNRFNSHTGLPMLTSGTISTVQAVLVQGSTFSGASVGFVIAGPANTMGSALVLFSTFTSSQVAVTTTVTFSGLGLNYTGSEFFVMFSDFSSSYIPVLGTGTTMGQGHHAYFGTATTLNTQSLAGLSSLSGLNALIRVTGNILPVELMKFEIE